METESKPRKPEGYLVVCNISKKHNVGNMVRSAVAMGMKEVVVIGMNKLSLQGAHGTDSHIPIRIFPNYDLAIQYFKEKGVTICGVEIDPTAVDVRTHPFRGDTAIMMGNEGTGMNERQKAMCDYFVYIPQFGTGTASLNVNVAASIVMHHFADYAGYEEAPRQKDCDKFYVNPQHRKQIIYWKDPEKAPSDYECGPLLYQDDSDDVGTEQ